MAKRKPGSKSRVASKNPKRATKRAPAKKKSGRAAKSKASKLATKKQRQGNILESLDLKTIRLIKLNTEIKILNNELPSEFETNVSVSIGKGSEDPGTIVVTVITGVTAHPPNGGEENSSQLDLAAQYQCILESDREIQIEEERETQQIVMFAVYACWPYFRETISSMTSRMGIPPLVIPIAKTRDFSFEDSGAKET